MVSQHNLPTLEQALDELDKIEKTYDEGVRIKETLKALEINETISKDKKAINKYYTRLEDKGLFVPIYGCGDAPWSLPLHLPKYLMEILVASSKVLLALVRNHLVEEGPDFLIRKMPKGWVTDEIAEKLHNYYLTFEPDLAFDVLVCGANSYRGMTFDEFKKSGDYLYAKTIEAQSVDTYYGWLRVCIASARKTGLFDDSIFSMIKENNKPISDEGLDEQVSSTYSYGLEDRMDEIVFLEIDPKKQPSYSNLDLLTKFMSKECPDKKPPILDPRELYFEGDQLYYKRNGNPTKVSKIISRLVDPDLKSFIKNMTDEKNYDAIETLRKIYETPSLWPDYSKHLAGYYLIDKSSVVDLSQLNLLGITPKTWNLTQEHLESYRKDPSLLNKLAIKPLHGMSSKGVYVTPDLATVEKYCAEEKMLAQDLIWATPIMPNINEELTDPDVQSGICAEVRLLLHAGSLAVKDYSHRSRCILALCRAHYSSEDPGRKIIDDPQDRGWFSNMGAIMAVMKEVGVLNKHNAGLGMGPVCWKE